MDINRYPKLIIKDEDDFIAISTDFIGCMAVGKTPEEALQHLKPAMLEWLDEAEERGISIPSPGSVSLNAPIAFLNGILEEGFKFKEISISGNEALDLMLSEISRHCKAMMERNNKDRHDPQKWDQLKNLVEALDFDSESYNRKRDEELLPYMKNECSGHA